MCAIEKNLIRVFSYTDKVYKINKLTDLGHCLPFQPDCVSNNSRPVNSI